MSQEKLSVTIPASNTFLPVAINFASAVADVFGLTASNKNTLTLITEELFAFIASQEANDEPLLIECQDVIYCTVLVFAFPKGRIPLDAFNLSNSFAQDENAERNEEIGLFLAARKANKMQIKELNGNKMEIRFIINRTYGDSGKQNCNSTMDGPFTFSEDPLTAKEFSMFLSTRENASNSGIFQSLMIPGMLSDMVKSGDYAFMATVDSRGFPAAGLVYSETGDTILVEGPYLLIDSKELCINLWEETIKKLARSNHIDALIIENADVVAIQSLQNEFEELPGGIFYRQMREDPGCISYVNSYAIDFVSNIYDSMSLPRIIHNASYCGESLNIKSAISTELDSLGKKAKMRLLSPGNDFKDCVAKHVRILENKGFSEMTFAVDLASPEESMLTPQLLENGFTLWRLLPWGTPAGDLLVLRRMAENNL